MKSIPRTYINSGYVPSFKYISFSWGITISLFAVPNPIPSLLNKHNPISTQYGHTTNIPLEAITVSIKWHQTGPLHGRAPFRRRGGGRAQWGFLVLVCRPDPSYAMRVCSATQWYWWFKGGSHPTTRDVRLTKGLQTARKDLKLSNETDKTDPVFNRYSHWWVIFKH